MACTVAEDLLAYALASTGKSRREARRTVRRILYTEGLRGLLATAPEDLRHRVQQVERPECLELVLLQHLREAS
jgi:hypothetical protein